MNIGPRHRPAARGSHADLDRYTEFAQHLNENLFYVTKLSHLADQGEFDSLAAALVNLSTPAGRTLPIIRSVVESEFQRNMRNPGSILRGNCVASKMMGACSRKIGAPYLKDCIGDLLMEVVGDKELDLELIPHKLLGKVVTTSVDEVTDGDVAKDERVQALQEKNYKELTAYATKFFNAIVSDDSINKMPRELRAIAGFTAEYARAFAPDRLEPLVGGFIMLRIFNPALVAPEGVGLLPKGTVMSPTARRNLTLITKMLQNVANGVLFGAKEEYMIPLNSFVEDNKETMRQFLVKLAADPDGKGWSAFVDPPTQFFRASDIDKKDIALLHRLAYQYKGNLLEELSVIMKAGTSDRNFEQDEEFFDCLDNLGVPENYVSTKKRTDETQAEVKYLEPTIKSGLLSGHKKKTGKKKRMFCFLTETFFHVFLSPLHTEPKRSFPTDDLTMTKTSEVHSFVDEEASPTSGAGSPTLGGLSGAQVLPSSPLVGGGSPGLSPAPDGSVPGESETSLTISYARKSITIFCQNRAHRDDWFNDISLAKRNRIRKAKERRHRDSSPASVENAASDSPLANRIRNHQLGSTMHYHARLVGFEQPSKHEDERNGEGTTPTPDDEEPVLFVIEVEAFGSCYELKKPASAFITIHHELGTLFNTAIWPRFPNGFEQAMAGRTQRHASISAPESDGGDEAKAEEDKTILTVSGSTPNPRNKVGGSGFHFKPHMRSVSTRTINVAPAQPASPRPLSEASGTTLANSSVPSMSADDAALPLSPSKHKAKQEKGQEGSGKAPVVLGFREDGRPSYGTLVLARFLSSYIHLILRTNAVVRQSDPVIKFLEVRSITRAIIEGNLMHFDRLRSLGVDFVAQVDARGRSPVHAATLAKRPAMLNSLISADSDIDRRDINGDTPLHLALWNADDKDEQLDPIVELLLALGSKPSLANNRGIHPLHIAAARGLMTAADALVNRGASIDARDGECLTPLVYAISNSCEEMAIALLKRGSDPHQQCRNGYNLVHLAVAAGLSETTAALVEKDKSLAIAVNVFGQTPMHIAAVRGGIDNVRLLSQFPNPCLSVDNDDFTPLVLAARSGCAAAVSILVPLSDVGHRVDSDMNRTGLHYAAAHGHAAAIRAFADQGSEFDASRIRSFVNAQDADGRTPLHIAVEARNIRAVRALLAIGADPLIARHDSRTPLHTAALLDQAKTCHTILKYVNRQAIVVADEDGSTPLHYAVWSRSSEVMEVFLKHNVDLSVADKVDGSTALHLAVTTRCHSIVEQLAPLCADQNAGDSNHNTPLHIAALQDDKESVHLLLAYDASTTVRNEKDLNVMDVASANAGDSVVKMLQVASSGGPSQGGTKRKPQAKKRMSMRMMGAITINRVKQES